MTHPTEMLRAYPNLPILSMPQCAEVFRTARMGPNQIASWTGYSRVAVSAWLRGIHTNPKKATSEAVSTLAYRVLRALKHQHYPLKTKRVLSEAPLRDTLYGQSLDCYSAQELLPQAWYEQIKLARLSNATARIL